MANRFNAHVRSDRAKWAVVTVAILALAVLITGLMTSWFKDFNPYCWFGHTYDEETHVCTKCGAEEPEDTAEEPVLEESVVVYDFAAVKTNTLGDIPSVSSMAAMVYTAAPKASSPVTMQNTYADNGKVTFKISGEIYKWTISFGGYSNTYTGSYNSMSMGGDPDAVFAQSTLTVNLDNLVSQGKISPDRLYTVTCEYQEFIWVDMGGMGTSGYTPSYTDTVTVGTLSVPTVSELPDPPTKTGYTFTGWYTDPECTNRYTEDKVIGDITLYAGFRANTYTIVFNANSGSGSMSNLSMTYDQSKALTANAFSKTGYTFKGWATSAGGSVVYSNSQSVKNLASAQGATVNLYAVWQANTYTIVFNANGGSGDMNNMSMTYDKSANLTSNAFTRKNHEFKGWATSAGGEVVYTNSQSISNLSAVNGDTINLYAVWELISYNVSFSVDGQVTSTIEVAKETAATLPEEPSKEGYNFVGWFMEDGTQYTNQAITADTTLTAKFEIIKCGVTFVVDGEFYGYYEVDYGTNLAELLGQNVNTLLYSVEGEYSENF